MKSHPSYPIAHDRPSNMYKTYPTSMHRFLAILPCRGSQSSIFQFANAQRKCAQSMPGPKHIKYAPGTTQQVPITRWEQTDPASQCTVIRNSAHTRK